MFSIFILFIEYCNSKSDIFAPMKIKPHSRKILTRLKAFRHRKSQKIICIGKNKTGTTSISALLKQLGYVVAPQEPAELLVHDWYKRDFRKIIDYVKNYGEAFQDIPFSLEETYEHLDKAFPTAKFILTIRDSPEQWYQSLTKFHGLQFGKGGRLPTKDDLMNATYRYRGFAWEVNRMLHNTPEEEPYQKERLIEAYHRYNQNVIDYFEGKDDKLLVVNLASSDALTKILAFLNKTGELAQMPWENKTL